MCLLLWYNLIKEGSIMNLSKSKYCNGLQCKKMLWLEKYKAEEKGELSNEAVLDNGNDVHEVARKLL